ncbi:MAG TPA: hypothetical protein VFA72_07165 [Burkholderiales bacterium]|nr:hypothetical protein [Burkholderiales bacterium]
MARIAKRSLTAASAYVIGGGLWENNFFANSQRQRVSGEFPEIRARS